MDLEKLKLFYHVAKAGSFRGAARELNMAQPGLSRRINVLEHVLKTKLFVRHSNGVLLTREGEIWFRHMKKVMTELETAKTIVAEDNTKVQGELKITTTFGFASTVLFQHLSDFAGLYPDVNIILICNDENLDLTMREADIAIAPTGLYDPGLIQTHLTSRTVNIYASKEYLSNFGEPKHPEELDQHRLIVFSPPRELLMYSVTSWLLKIGAPHGHIRTPYMVVNSVECMGQAAAKGLGIIALSQDSSLIKQHKLVHILKGNKGPTSEMYYVYPENLKHVRAVRALEGYLLEAFKGTSKVRKIS